ncbi:MAG: cell division protein [Actinomycetia bacterium]|jgi:cell division transport system permease protein|nr:cell division protein [Actinomycetes bacterium]
MSRLAYFVRETLISLRRNLLMTIAGIITVAISLFLFGGILLVSATVDHGTQQWKHGIELEIFMKVGATHTEVQTIENALKTDPQVKSYKYLSQLDAYNIFKKDFSDQPALVESTKPSDLPESFRVAPTKAELTQPLADAYQHRPSVDTVITAAKQIKSLLTATRWIRLVFISMATVLLASSLFLIVNTIRLATFARRREIEVMKLVGASNWFVRVPFMAEGLVQGAIGAGFAFGLVWILKIVITNLLGHHSQNLFSTFRVTSSDALGIGLIVLVIGALIGVVGSIVGLRRFLEA